MQQMTTPPGHNSRDPGVLFTVQEEEDMEQQRRRGEEVAAGALVGKNQTRPNYRNHNESVSRETLLPGKHQGIWRALLNHTSTHTFTLNKRPQVLRTYLHRKSRHRFTLLFLHMLVRSHAHTHPNPSADPDN